MKLACSSSAFDALLRAGDLTQLEWIDLCAHELRADGIVLDMRHFPRTDTDYLAQIKKMACDLCLCIAALREDAFFQHDGDAMRASTEVALALGAPLISAPMPFETAASWTDVLARLGTATSLAKAANVTLAVRNAPGTFGASAHDLKRVSKEADSAWLRYASDFGALDAASDPQELLGKTVLAWRQLDHPMSERDAALLESYRGHIAFDATGGNAGAEEMKNALREWRSALFSAVNRT